MGVLSEVGPPLREVIFQSWIRIPLPCVRPDTYIIIMLSASRNNYNPVFHSRCVNPI